jgi:diguanylate cyclase (GGDEF)-like protein/PAS domain S-box-containing protein
MARGQTGELRTPVAHHDGAAAPEPLPRPDPRSVAGLPLLEATPESVLIVDLDGRIEFANRRAAELTGLSQEDLEGRQLDEVIAGGLGDPASDQPFEALCRRPNGSEVRVEVRVGSLEGPQPLLVVTLRDVGDVHARLEAAVGAEARLRAVVEQISAITYTWAWENDQYFVVHTSPQIETILGYTTQEWIADPTAWYDWVHPEDRSAVIEENKRCETTAEAFSMQYRMIRKDGRTIWVEDSWVVVDDEHDDRLVFQGVVFDITERKLAEQEVAFLAHHDKLTGLPNRASFEEMLEMAISRARRRDLGVGLLFLDLDNFKLVNDSFGHQAGDRMLIELAERLRICTRDTDLVARQGGDEFLMLLADLERGVPGEGGEETAMVIPEAVADRIHQALREPFDLNGRRFHVSGSIGISLFPRDGLDANTLLKHADVAMYQAKKSTPGGHVLYAADDQKPLEKLALSTRLRRAVDEESWVLHYQPVVDLSNGHVRGVEALIRWLEPNGGLVPPGEFIPLAEELGLIEEIGDWVIDEMARQQKEWADDGLDLEMSFNLSPRQLWSAHLADRVLGKLEAAGVDPHRIVVEITESTAMADPDRTQQILADLHAWGLTLAIDDFGTGYSSLARLKHMPVDILKIDRAFVRDVDKDLGLAGMVRAMIQLAQSLNMTPLAEGVETFGEYVFLRSNGCRLAQGFYFAKPAPAEAIPSLASRKHGLIPQDASYLR